MPTMRTACGIIAFDLDDALMDLGNQIGWHGGRGTVAGGAVA
ncbi:MAG: hypothetical protein U0894_01630 [Pirellulales bacterium]